MEKIIRLSSEKHEAKRAGISADVERFLAGGGEIEQLSYAATSNTKLTPYEQPVSESVLGDIKRIIARRKK